VAKYRRCRQRPAPLCFFTRTINTIYKEKLGMNSMATVSEWPEQVEVTKAGGTVGTAATGTTVSARDEQFNWHAQHASQLAGPFLRQVESQGYDGYAIVGVRNEVMHGSELEIHVEDCNECNVADHFHLCDEGFSALLADEAHSVFVYKTNGAGGEADYSGLFSDLTDDGRTNVYDLLCDADALPEQPATNGPTDSAPTIHAPEPVYTPEFWKAAYALVDAQQKCEICKQYRNLKTRPFVDVRVVLTGDGTPRPDSLHLLCTRCHPEPKADRKKKAA
jgi:hypothetical protein